ncbi:hypothetical protein HOY80DRAFT_963874 [Tuber brumale]|nr:hypothetical protein HOY80DRAFT_963874 [Tuber brumale]
MRSLAIWICCIIAILVQCRYGNGINAQLNRVETLTLSPSFLFIPQLPFLSLPVSPTFNSRSRLCSSFLPTCFCITQYSTVQYLD